MCVVCEFPECLTESGVGEVVASVCPVSPVVCIGCYEVVWEVSELVSVCDLSNLSTYCVVGNTVHVVCCPEVVSVFPE